MLENFHRLPLYEQVKGVRSGRFSIDKIVRSYQERASLFDGELNSLLSIRSFEKDEFIKQCGYSDVLAGSTILIKDNICTEGLPTTCGSRMLEGYHSPYSATVVEKLCKQGAIILGKTNLDEFAMGSSNETSYFGPVKNPWNKKRVPGGSSGGSAAAVAAGLAGAALGSDTGGSIRQPASYTGTVGLKPSYGRVSRYGLVAFASSLDQIGPMTRTVFDAAVLLDAISGFDLKDSKSAKLPPTRAAEFLEKIDVSNLADTAGIKTIGLVKEGLGEGNQEEVKIAFEKAVRTFEKMGIAVKEVSLPFLKWSVNSYYLIASAEASSNLARFDGVRYGLRETSRTLEEMYRKSRSKGFGAEVKTRIMLGSFALSSGYYEDFYAKAQDLRNRIRSDLFSSFEQGCDLLALPTTPTTAFELGSKINDPISMYLQDIYTISANLAGLPAISIPCGKDTEGMPIGLQLMAPMFGEEKLLAGAYGFELETQEWKMDLPNGYS